MIRSLQNQLNQSMDDLFTPNTFEFGYCVMSLDQAERMLMQSDLTVLKLSGVDTKNLSLKGFQMSKENHNRNKKDSSFCRNSFQEFKKYVLFPKAKGNSLNAIKERKMKDEICFQKAICLALLGFFGNFTIKIPKKMTSATNPLQCLVQISLQNNNINVEELVEKVYNMTDPKNKMEGSKKTIQRIHNKNIMYATSNFLLDVLRLCGFFFDSKYPKKSCKCVEQERVLRIYYHNKLLLTKEDINSFGKEINDF
ncbi:hypothetical protein EIN_526600 [Entamoeba invadens IP1]|uniref:Uncharacterized protein n=1 Tax=Entamoeba invadens IP1 TaxID=370355 RepID=A0A0A1U5T3_ENTIV|nr:hypothetical protein EIN_526600 [Entamoeba invadens IP1]ELP89615.1 hypothetical protein EIN_526600 [Entamoeba invadens IP1]|eukprot:XP_004256386.1 hypothetical protein EIN_526600 [Entamoeba invadens IP1]